MPRSFPARQHSAGHRARADDRRRGHGHSGGSPHPGRQHLPWWR